MPTKTYICGCGDVFMEGYACPICEPKLKNQSIINTEDQRCYFRPNSQDDCHITINSPNGLLVKISTKDGRITYGSHYSPDEAARIFWQALGAATPKVVEKRIRAEVRAQLLDVLKP